MIYIKLIGSSSAYSYKGKDERDLSVCVSVHVIGESSRDAVRFRRYTSLLNYGRAIVTFTLIGFDRCCN
jgi:hypothetical protein